MRRFTQLFIEMDRTTRSSEKLAAMARYFREVSPQDAAWALFFLSGRKLKRLTNWRVMDDAIRAATGLAPWLISESYEAVGDGAEMMALLYPNDPANADGLDESLHELAEKRLLTLRTMADPAQQSASIRATWREMTQDQRLVFNKLLTGAFRVGVAQTSIVKSLAEVAQVSPAVMAHRFAGNWEPTAQSFLALIGGGGDGATSDLSENTAPGAKPQAADVAQPYPFLLGYPLEGEVSDLGPIDRWQVEWKYDGLRAQVIRRQGLSGGAIIWSRGEELITPAFPEIAHSAAQLPDGTVLDGEIVAWDVGGADRALPFALLQRRINRKQVEISLWPDVPVMYIAFDVLEEAGVDVRERPLCERRAMLEHLIDARRHQAMRVSPLVPFTSWDQLTQLRLESRQRSVEGVMLKRLDTPYAVGRRKGDWWKWKIDPYTVDAVLIYAQGGSGRRSGLFTDYTFGVWDEREGTRELVPVAKAYSGLTDEEIRQVDRFIRANTLEKRGPVRIVKPELVFELAFEGIAESDRHKAQLALRFPRMHRWRTDKKADEADTLATLQALLKSHTSIHHGNRTRAQ